MSNIRSEKIADLLKKEISSIISQDTKDPRLQLINVTAVKVSDDISVADVYYTVIGESIKKTDSEIESNILKKFSGMVRSKLSKLIKIRRIPKINFRFDESIHYSQNIDFLLKNLN
tara:strand:+ start:639 stop:986 length:348 start_codon:yes stop_codon:yes gene_type:complete